MMWPSLIFLLLQAGCVDCHDEPEESPATSVHSRAELSCVSCHGTESSALDPKAANPHTPEFRARTSRRHLSTFCGTCHEAEAQSFAQSDHHRETVEDGGKLRGCLECHSAHGTKPAERDSILQEQCWRCHASSSAEGRAGMEYVVGADGFQIREQRLAAVLKTLRSTPGILLRGEEGVREEAGRKLEAMRTRQHSLAYDSLLSEAAGSVRAMEEAYQSLGRKEQWFRWRVLPLGVFLLFLGVATWVIRKKEAAR